MTDWLADGVCYHADAMTWVLGFGMVAVAVLGVVSGALFWELRRRLREDGERR